MDAGDPRAISDALPAAEGAVWSVPPPYRLRVGEVTSPFVADPMLLLLDVLRALRIFSASLLDPPNRLRLEGDFTTSLTGEEAEFGPVEPDLERDGLLVSIGESRAPPEDDDEA